MAKKKPASKPDPKPETKQATAAERLTVFSLKGSYEYRDWLSTISKKTLIPTAIIARDALAKWAAERSLPSPPEV